MRYAVVETEVDSQETVANRWETVDQVQKTVSLGPGIRVLYTREHSGETDMHAYTELFQESGWVVVATGVLNGQDYADIMPIDEVSES